MKLIKFVEKGSRAALGVKVATTAALALVVLTACGTPNYHFTQYVGQQQNWTTSPGSFVRTVEGVPIYTHYPPMPYELIGAVSVNNEKSLARAAKMYHADAALLYQRSTTVSGSMVVGGPPVYAAYPVYDSRITAHLIRFKK